jgi:anti-sigma factor RsiW
MAGCADLDGRPLSALEPPSSELVKQPRVLGISKRQRDEGAFHRLWLAAFSSAWWLGRFGRLTGAASYAATASTLGTAAPGLAAAPTSAITFARSKRPLSAKRNRA